MLDPRIVLTIAANGDEPLGEPAENAVDALMEAMNNLSPAQRVTIFQILHDYFCWRCGIEQPPGDCQCGKAR